jgi:hypothetical protein
MMNSGHVFLYRQVVDRKQLGVAICVEALP